MARTPKNEADRAVHVTVSVPKHLKDRMTAFNKNTNWSSVAKDAFEVEVARLEANPPAPAPAAVVVDTAPVVVAPDVVVEDVPAVEAAGTPAVAVDSVATVAPVADAPAVDVPEPEPVAAPVVAPAEVAPAPTADEAKKAE